MSWSTSLDNMSLFTHKKEAEPSSLFGDSYLLLENSCLYSGSR